MGHGADPARRIRDLVARVRRYRLLTRPPLVLAAILVPLAVVDEVQFGFLLFVLVLAYALFVLPHLRNRATRDCSTRTALEPGPD